MHKTSLNFQNFFTCFVLFIWILAVFWKLPYFDFINIDDPIYVHSNEIIKHGFSIQSLKSAFLDIVGGYWIPVTWISFMVDYSLYGLLPGGYHLTNLILHIINTILLFFLFKQITQTHWRSVLVAILFAIHPLHIESVAWITERKDVLYTFFWILTQILYFYYTQNKRLINYIAFHLLFALGLMAKPMMVTLPFVLILMDYWPLSRFHKIDKNSSIANYFQKNLSLFMEKVPLLILSIAISLTTFLTQLNLGSVTSFAKYSFNVRVNNAFLSYLVYIKKLIFPYPIAIYYPHPKNNISINIVIISFFIISLISYIAVKQITQKPYLAVGWFWFIGTIFPVIGLTQAGEQGLADRFTYVPYIGLFIIIAWGTNDIIKKWNHLKNTILFIIICILLIFTLISTKHVEYWENSITISEQALKVTENNAFVHGSLGRAYREKGDLYNARKQFEAVLSINPRSIPIINDLAVTQSYQGQFEDALSTFNKIIEIDPLNAQAHNDIGITLGKMGKHQEAIEHFKFSLKLKPDNAEAQRNIGITLANMKRYKEAIQHFRISLQLKPENNESANFLQKALEDLKQNLEP